MKTIKSDSNRTGNLAAAHRSRSAAAAAHAVSAEIDKAFAVNLDVSTCRICGCIVDNPFPGGCYPDLCSRCADLAATDPGPVPELSPGPTTVMDLEILKEEKVAGDLLRELARLRNQKRFVKGELANFIMRLEQFQIDLRTLIDLGVL